MRLTTGSVDALVVRMRRARRSAWDRAIGTSDRGRLGPYMRHRMRRTLAVNVGQLRL